MTADLLFVNGKLWTQDVRFPAATALALQGPRILAVGDDAALRALAGPRTEIIDLHGARVLPGLTDAHCHFQLWAQARQQLDLTDAPSLAAVQEALAAAAQQTPPGQWIRGYGWNETDWPAARLLTRHDLDAAAPQHPVILWRSDLHLAAVNTAALRLAGIVAATPNPTTGIIDRQPDGQPSGVLRDHAIELVQAVLPAPDAATVDAAMRSTIAAAHQLGLTGIHDFRIGDAAESRSAWHTWQRLHAAGDLALRVWLMLDGTLLDEAVQIGLRSGFGDDRLRIGGLKYFADGSLGARTAWMLEPYNDGGTGLPVVPMTHLADAIRRADAAGLTVGIHAIGDRALRELLDVFRAVLPADRRPTTALPHRIEHVQHSTVTDLLRLGQLGLVASVQPVHLADDLPLVEQALGPRGQWSYAWRTLLEGGAVLALGSDCPVASANPFWGIQTAVTRQRRDGSPADGWYPEQRLTVAEAVAGYTLGPAYASGQLHQQGSLAPGKLADLIVLDRDIFAVPPQEIGATQVTMTVFDGRIVHG
ncbi:MAG: amidohydrolase [Anaerolineae bacterium]